jgi:hypothetical protein
VLQIDSSNQWAIEVRNPMEIENLMICLMVGHQWEARYPLDVSLGDGCSSNQNAEEWQCRRCGKTELNFEL